MFWADKILRDIQKSRSRDIEKGDTLIIRDEKTASGRVHVGSMRGVAIHGIISEVLSEAGIAHRYLYEINDFDPMDGLPAYLDEKTFGPYMGKPLYTIPSPDGKAKNFAEFYGQEYLNVITEAGFYPETYRTSEFYLSGKMNDVIRIALERADDIRDIFKKVSGSEKPEGWLPINVVCQHCGRISTTTVSAFDGDVVSYECKKDAVEWTEGCGHKDSISPFDGNAKLSWKVDWAAKFVVHGVHIEGAGKDHATKGGARDVADAIAKEVYEYTPPFDIPYEFFLVGGKKMSSSKGSGSSSREIADLVPIEIFRLALIGKEPKRTVEFDPGGDTIPILFDTYDKLAEKYYGGAGDDDARLFPFLHEPDERGELEAHYLPRFSQVAFLTQLPHINLEGEFAKMKGTPFTELDRHELNHRKAYAKRWLETVAPEDYKFELQETPPEVMKTFSDIQKEALKKVAEYIASKEDHDGQELHTKLHDIKKELNIAPKDFFSALYLSLLNKESGPKAGWFLSVLDRDFLLKRLRTVAK